MIALLKFAPVWAYILVAGILFGGVQTLRLHNAKQDIAIATANASICASAQDENLTTIAKLTVANAKWAKTNASNLDLAKIYSDQANDYRNKLQSRYETSQNKLKVIYDRVPEARAWADVSVPADVADQLRANANR